MERRVFRVLRIIAGVALIAFALIAAYLHSQGNESLDPLRYLIFLILVLLSPFIFRVQRQQYRRYVDANPSARRADKRSSVLMWVGIALLILPTLGFVLAAATRTTNGLSHDSLLVLFMVTNVLTAIGALLLLYRVAVWSIGFYRARQMDKSQE